MRCFSPEKISSPDSIDLAGLAGLLSMWISSIIRLRKALSMIISVLTDFQENVLEEGKAIVTLLRDLLYNSSSLLKQVVTTLGFISFSPTSLFDPHFILNNGTSFFFSFWQTEREADQFFSLWLR